MLLRRRGGRKGSMQTREKTSILRPRINSSCAPIGFEALLGQRRKSFSDWLGRAEAGVKWDRPACFFPKLLRTITAIPQTQHIGTYKLREPGI